MKILIVDDEKIILEKLKMYISQIFTEKENIFTSDNAVTMDTSMSYIPHFSISC